MNSAFTPFQNQTLAENITNALGSSFFSSEGKVDSDTPMPELERQPSAYVPFAPVRIINEDFQPYRTVESRNKMRRVRARAVRRSVLKKLRAMGVTKTDQYEILVASGKYSRMDYTEMCRKSRITADWTEEMLGIFHDFILNNTAAGENDIPDRYRVGTIEKMSEINKQNKRTFETMRDLLKIYEASSGIHMDMIDRLVWIDSI